MSARALVSIFILAAVASGCATVPRLVGKDQTATPTPTCTSAADCQAKWSAAHSYILTHASYGIQNDSVDRIETYNPNNDVTQGLRAKVNREIQPDGSFAIVAKFWCNNLFECSPSADKTLEDFNRTIGAVGQAAAMPGTAATAVTAPAAAPAAAPAIAAMPATRPVAPAPTAPSATNAGGATLSGNTEQYIRDSESAWAESVATHDASVVTRIMADDCVWVLDGQPQDKATAIRTASSAAGEFISNHLEHATVRIYGDTAVAQGSDSWTRQGGKTGHFVWTDTWMRRNGQWQIVAGQVSTTN